MLEDCEMLLNDLDDLCLLYTYSFEILFFLKATKMLSPVDFVVAGHLGCNNHSEDTPEAAEDPNNQN